MLIKEGEDSCDTGIRDRYLYLFISQQYEIYILILLR